MGERPMKRRLLIIAIFLLAGAVVNVAVAWGCALCLRFTLARSAPSVDLWDTAADGSYWAVTKASGFGASRYQWLPIPARVARLDPPPPQPPVREALPAWSAVPRTPRDRPPGRGLYLLIEDACGWPAVTLTCTYDMWFRGADYVVDVSGGWRLFDADLVGPTLISTSLDRHFAGMVPTTLPLRPSWGLFANTIFYATLLWLLIPGPFVLRRYLRARRGLCPKCAYPMGESSVCTECGRALPKRARTT